jgi:hypothetical protein
LGVAGVPPPFSGLPSSSRPGPLYPSEQMRASIPARSAAVLLLAVLCLAGCGSEGPTEPVRSSGRAFTVTAGQDLEVRLQSIGPGEYRSPPSISSDAIRFRDVSLATPHVPAGVTQLFRFQAVTPGRALVVFRHTEQSAIVIDTVKVE